MTTPIDADTAALLDGYSPPPAVDPSWADVIRRAPAARRGPRPATWAARGAAALALAAAVLAVTWLWPRNHDSVVQQALAAVDAGPVLHAVMQIEGDTRLVDLRTGASSPLVSRTELWEDGRIGAVVQTSLRGQTGPRVYLLRRNEPRLAGARPEDLLRGYRDALRRGEFRSVGHGRVGGVDVDWLEGQPPLVLHDAASSGGATAHQRVAVDARTFEPVLIETFAGGRRVSTERFLGIATVPLAGSPLAHPPARPTLVSEIPARDTPSTTLAAAARTMGTTPRVPSRTVAGLRRTWIGQPLFLVGPTWASVHEPPGVVLFYGDTLNYRQPNYDRRHVAISEFPSLDPVFSREGLGSFPADGKAVAVRNTLTFRHGGLFVQVEASSPALALAGARAVMRS
jgi:hypothetical protein